MYKPKRTTKSGKPNELFFSTLPQEVTEEDLKAFYSDFGEVESARIVRRGKKGGFGFLSFKHNESVGRAMAGRPHSINGASMTPIRAELGDSPYRSVQVVRLFVGNLTTPELHNESKIRATFAKYGDIEEIKFKNDEEGKPRNFAVITFTDPDSCDKAILAARHVIDGQQIKIKKFLNEDESKEARQRVRDKKERTERSGRDNFMTSGRSGGSFNAMGGGWTGFPGPAYGGGMGYQGMGAPNGYSGGMATGYGAGPQSLLGGVQSFQSNGSRISSGAGPQSLLDGVQSFQSNGSQNSTGMNGYTGGRQTAANSNSNSNLKAILLKATISPESIEILSRERALDTELLRSTSADELEAMGIAFGDRKRIQILMN